MGPVIVVPALAPGAPLVASVRALRARVAVPIIVVDDGSGPAYGAVFRTVTSVPGVTVLSHDENRGKGHALRTAMARVLDRHREAVGVVTADADGQHAVEDIVAVSRAMRDHPDALVLGARRFTRDAPVANRLGNRLARWLLRRVTGRALRDTQTGLRGIPRRYLRELVALGGARYEFELEMLLWACARGIAIHEHPIRTIYGDAASHFAAVRDSARMARVLVRFAAGRAWTAAAGHWVTPQTSTPSTGHPARANGSGPYALE
jgi:glycosyltransferase involved in cell wall biosynthesis